MGCSNSTDSSRDANQPGDYHCENDNLRPQSSKEENGIMSFLRQMSTSSMGDGPVDSLSASNSPDTRKKSTKLVSKNSLSSTVECQSEKDETHPAENTLVTSDCAADELKAIDESDKTSEQLQFTAVHLTGNDSIDEAQSDAPSNANLVPSVLDDSVNCNSVSEAEPEADACEGVQSEHSDSSPSDHIAENTVATTELPPNSESDVTHISLSAISAASQDFTELAVNGETAVSDAVHEYKETMSNGDKDEIGASPEEEGSSALPVSADDSLTLDEINSILPSNRSVSSRESSERVKSVTEDIQDEKDDVTDIPLSGEEPARPAQEIAEEHVPSDVQCGMKTDGREYPLPSSKFHGAMESSSPNTNTTLRASAGRVSLSPGMGRKKFASAASAVIQNNRRRRTMGGATSDLTKAVATPSVMRETNAQRINREAALKKREALKARGAPNRAFSAKPTSTGGNPFK